MQFFINIWCFWSIIRHPATLTQYFVFTVIDVPTKIRRKGSIVLSAWSSEIFIQTEGILNKLLFLYESAFQRVNSF